MKITAAGNETFLYINGIVVNEEIKLTQNQILLPATVPSTFDTFANLVKESIDFGVVYLFSMSIFSQMKISADNPKNLAIRSWNSVWDILLISAILNCEAISNMQCTQPIEEITTESQLHVTNYHLHGLVNNPYTITKADATWLSEYFINARNLLDNNTSFSTAVHSLSTYRWHSMPRVQLAILWAGIESIFKINYELSFRLSLYIAKFLGENSKEDMQNIFDEAKSLYKARSSAVHGSKIKGQEKVYVKKSASLLNKLIKKCIENNEMPDINKLIF